jgi:hypothetical protein
MVRWLFGFVIAASVMIVLGSAAHSYFVQEAWVTAAGQAEGAGPAALPLADRLGWFAADLIDMERNSPPYGALTGVALLIAFLVAGIVARLTGMRALVFAGAGAVAIFVLFTALKLSLGTVGVFGARGAMGLGAQMAAGLIAGLVFAAFTRPRSA